MKRMILTTKFLSIVAGISLISLVMISTAGSNLSNKQSAIYKMASGMNICFQRVNQTFTALMIRDFSSNFVSNNFKNTTGECFSQLSTALATTMQASSKVPEQMNNLMSDVHWFAQKVDRVATMAKTEEIDLFQSNIVGKYEQLETLKMEVEEQIIASASSIESNKSLAMAAMIISQLVLLFSIMTLFLKKKLTTSGIDSVEKYVDKNLAESDHHLLAQKIMKKLFSALEIPKTKNFMTNYFNTLIEENYRMKDHLVKANTIGETVELSEVAPALVNNDKKVVCDFNHSLNAVISRVKEKAFNHGIMLDVDVQDQFRVYSDTEALDQFLFYMVSYAMDSSLEHNQGRKVIIKGKPLGGIAYCKVKIAGHAFSTKDFAVINGKDPDKDTNVHLVLLKELIVDSGARLAVKNKTNQESGLIESELEVIFDRAHVDEKSQSPARTNILKGTKKELANFFRNTETTI